MPSPDDDRLHRCSAAGPTAPHHQRRSGAGSRGTFEPLTADSFITGYVDLDDLLGSSDTGFELLRFFGAGEYQPHSGSGRHLLAHELAHVV